MKHWMYIVLILALLGFGYWYTENQQQAGYDKAVAECNGRENKELKKARAETAAQVQKNNELSGQLETAQRKITRTSKLIQELQQRYETEAQNSNLCNLTLGSIMLHNASLGYEYDTGKLDDTGRALSTITGAAFIQHCNGLGTEFERQREQLNLLIQAKGCRK